MNKLLIIKRPYIFKCVARQGITIRNKAFILKFLSSNKSHTLLDINNVQIGLILSKKLGIAVKRNYMKRRLKNALKDSLIDFVFTGFYVFIVKDNLNYISYEEIIHNIKCSLKNLQKLLKSNEWRN